ncbi:MAG TPA: ShlB/FhaC/HecB family hemolysin secretion/activation protein [Stellaceae bacterium]|jgi:hemolysin activation/secretion protein|nr:ShlB/FhaC/HecB family hemolysin secretion/activation protein [Stellaceae bacterium]
MAGAAFAQQQVAPSRVTPESLRPAPAAAPTIELPSAAPEAVPAAAANLSVTVGQFAVAGTFPGFEDETAGLLDPLRGQRLTVAQIFATAAQLEQAYAAAGYVLARVVVAQQKLIDGGTVRLVVVDGVVERVDVNAVPERLRDVVAARMAAIVGEPHVTLAEIERRLLLVSDLPGLQLRSTLAAGATPGGTLLVVEATQNYVTGSVGISDRLPRSLGTWTLDTNLAINDALGFGEQAYMSYSSNPDFGDARLRVRGGGIVLPIGPDGFTLNPEYTESIARPVPALGTPNTQGDFRRFALHAGYPLIRSRAQTLSLQVTGEWDDEKLNATDFGTLLYHDAYGAARFGAHDAIELPWGATAALDGTFSHGIAGRGGSVAVPLSQLGSSPVFNKLSGLVGLRQPLPAAFELDVTGRGQTSFGSPLMLAEQFSLDGPDALSSFAAGTFSVDQGLSLRGELARPVLLSFAGVPPLTLVPYVFGAYGYGQIVTPTAVQQAIINAGSAGIGLRSAAGAAVAGLPLGSTLAVEFGRQFSDVPGLRNGYRANLAVSFTF